MSSVEALVPRLSSTVAGECVTSAGQDEELDKGRCGAFSAEVAAVASLRGEHVPHRPNRVPMRMQCSNSRARSRA